MMDLYEEFRKHEGKASKEAFDALISVLRKEADERDWHHHFWEVLGEAGVTHLVPTRVTISRASKVRTAAPEFLSEEGEKSGAMGATWNDVRVVTRHEQDFDTGGQCACDKVTNAEEILSKLERDSIKPYLHIHSHETVHVSCDSRHCTNA